MWFPLCISAPQTFSINIVDRPWLNQKRWRSNGTSLNFKWNKKWNCTQKRRTNQKWKAWNVNMQKFVVKKSKSAPPPQPKASQDASASSTAVAPTIATKPNSSPNTVLAPPTTTASQSSASPSPSSTGTTQVNMSGYLKKKRNVSRWQSLKKEKCRNKTQNY